MVQCAKRQKKLWGNCRPQVTALRPAAMRCALSNCYVVTPPGDSNVYRTSSSSHKIGQKQAEAKLLASACKSNLSGGDSVNLKSLTEQDLSAMRDVDIQTVDKDTLVDIRDIKIDSSLSKEDRMLSYIRQIVNPYCYRCGNTVVKASFANVEKTLEDRLENYIESM